MHDIELGTMGMIDAIQSGQTDPFSQAHLMELGTAIGVPESLLRPLQTTRGQELLSAQKEVLGSILKNTFKGTTTKREIDIAQAMLAKAGQTKEANLAAAFLQQAAGEIIKEKLNIVKQLREEGYSNYDIPEMIDERLSPIRRQIFEEYIDAVTELSKK